MRAQELRKIRMGFGIKSVNPIIINILISEQLGYTKEEGLAFTPASLGTNANVQIALDKGDVDFGVGTPSFQLPLFAKGQLPPIVKYYEYTYPYKWDVAVKPESGIQKYEDLKGKKIGVSDLGTTDYPVTARGAAEHRHRSRQGRDLDRGRRRRHGRRRASARRDRRARLFRHRFRPDRRRRHRACGCCRGRPTCR